MAEKYWCEYARLQVLAPKKLSHSKCSICIRRWIVAAAALTTATNQRNWKRLDTIDFVRYVIRGTKYATHKHSCCDVCSISLSLLISLFLCSLEFNRCITNVYDDGAKLKWHVFLFLLFLFCYSFLVPFNIRSAFRKKRKKNVRRAQSAAEFDQQTLTAAHKRSIFK